MRISVRMLAAMALLLIVAASFSVTAAKASLIYQNTFTDMTDVKNGSTGGSSVAVSSDVASDGTTSLKYTSVVGNLAIANITPTIGGGLNTDPAITVIVSYYAAAASANDYMQFQVNKTYAPNVGGFPLAHNDNNVISNHGYPTAGNLGVYSQGWTNTGVAWPTGPGTGWFTIAYYLDTPDQKYSVYAAPGTSVNASNFVGNYNMLGTAVTPTTFAITSSNGNEPVFYIDNFQIFDGNPFAVPEPATIGMLGLALIGFVGQRSGRSNKAERIPGYLWDRFFPFARRI